MDASVPEDVRRRILEASVRAPQDWHQDAIRAAYASDDDAWRLTAVFCMRFVRGFDEQILEALDSENPDIHYEAVCAAGSWEVDAAWPHITALVTSRKTEKSLLLAAIEAVAASVRTKPQRSSRTWPTPTTRISATQCSRPLAMAEGRSDEDAEDDELRH